MTKLHGDACVGGKGGRKGEEKRGGPSPTVLLLCRELRANRYTQRLEPSTRLRAMRWEKLLGSESVCYGREAEGSEKRQKQKNLVVFRPKFLKLVFRRLTWSI